MVEMFGRIKVKLVGITPLLMNKITPEKLQDESKSKMRSQVYDAEKDAREGAYIDVIDGKEQLYIPSEAVYAMIVQTSAAYRPIGAKGGSRSSMRSILAGGLRIEPNKIPLGKSDYEVDLRRVRIKSASGASVARARAKVFPWEAKFTILYYKLLISEANAKQLQSILEDAGIRMGLLDFRPQHLGWFGTFKVDQFEVIS